MCVCEGKEGREGGRERGETSISTRIVRVKEGKEREGGKEGRGERCQG